MPISLSICLIVNNEEENLFRCLSSIKEIGGEIIVVDTGSSDNSILIARQFTDQVYSYEWKDDFSSARNFCLDQANGEWILVIDGDENLDSNCRYLLQDKIQVPDVEAYLLTVNHYSRNPHELLLMAAEQLRLFRNNRNYRYRGIIHEQIMDSILESNPSVRIEIAQDISITHYGFTEKDNENQYRLKRNTDLVNNAPGTEEEKHFHLGIEYYRHHKFAEALEHFQFTYNRVAHEDICFPELLRSITISLYMLDKGTEALSFINEALVILPDNVDFYYLKGIICKDLGYYVQAYEAFRKSLSALSPMPYYSIYSRHTYKTYYLLGGLAEYFMDKESALFYYFESLTHDPFMLDSLRRMIIILNPRINPEYTVKSLNRIFDLSDKNLQAKIAILFYEEGAYQPALDCIQQFENYGQISEYMRLLKGLCLLGQKRYCEAEEELRAINDNKKLYLQAQQDLLIYYWLVQDYAKASGCLGRIKNVGLDPAIIYVLNLLTGGYIRKINTVSDQGYTLARHIMDLVVEHGDSNRVNEAFLSLAPVLGERPSRLLAELFYKYERYELAEEEFRCLLKNGYTDAQAFYYLGKSCWALGDLNAAEENLREAINKGLDTPKIRWEIARLYQELSISTLQELLGQGPEKEGLQKIICQLTDNLLEV